MDITDINFDKGSIKINKQYTNRAFKEGAKNPARVVRVLEREIYMFKDNVELLREYIKTLPAGTKLLFPNEVNGYMDANNLRRRIWQPLLDYSNITQRVRIHDLRGSYADIAFSRGASLKFVQNQLGHTKSSTTLDIYTKNNSDMIINAMERMNGIFN